MKSDTLIRYQGMKILREHLGLIEAEKFIALIKREPFDYTEWQRTLWPGKSVDEIFEAARQYQQQQHEVVVPKIS
jgi:hypothetical protein